MPGRSKSARLASAVGVLLATSVPLLLLATWGHLYAVEVVKDSPGFPTVVTAVNGSVLSQSVEIALIALSCLVVGLGLAAIVRAIHPALLALCGAAMAAELVLILVRWNAHGLFVRRNVDVGAFHWTLGPAWIAAVILSAAGLTVWLGLFVENLVGVRVCPDCAEPISRAAVDCPHCGYKLPLSGGSKRCEACQRPVKAEAKVCRHCGHRFGSQLTLG
jgi:RNA polymerase subunit RPABC4/transcription elongation factor Spt4